MELSGDPKWTHKPDFFPTSIQVGCAGQETNEGGSNLGAWASSLASAIAVDQWRGAPLSSSLERGHARTRVGLLAFQVLVILPTLLGIPLLLAGQSAYLKTVVVELAVWIVVVGTVELLPVPMWRGTHISMGFPLLMAVGFLYRPSAAALVALLAASDPREFRRQISPLRALFNRCQVALSVLAASATFHSFASINSESTISLIGAAMLAAIVDYVVNWSLVALVAGIDYRMSPVIVIRQMRVGNWREFVVSYLGLAVFGLILAKLFNIQDVKFWIVPGYVAPLLLARQMFFRSKALEEAHKELQDREHVLRALSTRMAEERQDERAQIAAYLHDDLAQLLFKLSLQVDITKRHLAAGKVAEAEKTLEEIKDTKGKTSDRIRVLIRDLHRSPLGRAGLEEALHGFISEVGRGSEVRFHTDISEVALPAPIALLVYHIAREGVMNGLKHAHASNMWLTVQELGDNVELVLKDDGDGFDAEAPGPEGHYGLTMMRERATVGGGTFEIQTAAGAGTTITVTFPTSWLQQGAAPVPEPQPSRADASPGTATPAGELAPQSVLASRPR
jgi:signal transduction histidine kinase